MKTSKPAVWETKHTEVKQNPLTGDYLVIPKPEVQQLSCPYSCPTIRRASQMAQTMDHYEETGERKAFPVNLQYLKKVA